jgi:trk system potassium uptake protein TrkA
MRIIVVGCGRMGAGLARTLALRGHDVTVMDQDPAAFEQLGAAFSGRTVIGVGFDREALLRAGIERADGLAAVTASDEANVVTARLAGKVFQVPRVVARVYDPRKAEIYDRLGLQTIAPVTWGINQIADLISYSPLETIVSLGSGEINLMRAEIPSLLVGRTVEELTVPSEIQVVAVSRAGRILLPTLGTVFQQGDVVDVAVLAASTERLMSLLGLA